MHRQLNPEKRQNVEQWQADKRESKEQGLSEDVRSVAGESKPSCNCIKLCYVQKPNPLWQIAGLIQSTYYENKHTAFRLSQNRMDSAHGVHTTPPPPYTSRVPHVWLCFHGAPNRPFAPLVQHTTQQRSRTACHVYRAHLKDCAFLAEHDVIRTLR